MEPDYQIWTDEGLIRVKHSGKAYDEITTEMLHAIANFAAETGSKKVLVDLRDAHYNDRHAAAIRHAEESLSTGVDTNFRWALVGAPKDESMLKYFEDVGVNRGFHVKIFLDEREAIEWLRSS